MTLGYQNTTGSETINELWNILRNRSSSFYPGEGDRILNILAEIELYQFNIDDTRDLANSAEAMIGIINRILEEESAIYNQQVDSIKIRYFNFSFKDTINVSIYQKRGIFS